MNGPALRRAGGVLLLKGIKFFPRMVNDARAHQCMRGVNPVPQKVYARREGLQADIRFQAQP